VITSWSPSRLEKWETCARRAKYDIVDALCPKCFKGRLEGIWGQPRICKSCVTMEDIPDALARGTRLHTACEETLRHGKPSNPTPELARVKKILTKLRTAFKRGEVKIEQALVFDQAWRPVSKFTRGAWLRTALDVLVTSKGKATVIDWKSGGVDSRTGEIRPNEKYDDQLNVYATAVLSADPEVEEVEAKLVFIDGPEGRNVVESGGTATRKDLVKLQTKWSARARSMLSDTVFAPRPSDSACRFCPFSRAKGGPCAF
jgi:hypothetical protein